MQSKFYAVKRELFWIEPSEIEMSIVDCKGKAFHDIFEKVRVIIAHQIGNARLKGIKGFIFHGEVGTGKTLMGKVLAKDLSIPLLFVDGSVIAREYYGQSEQQIVRVFDEAKHKKGIILIDDAESVFPDREWIKGESWHVAQNNILFHQVDNLDTSQSVVVMTTNKYELLDKALKDRLYPIEFPKPDLETIIEIASLKCIEKNLKPDAIIQKIRSNPDLFQSVRSVEKLVIEEYINGLRK
jgi:SpoVK/Ycf46/Vps4 family AAA+-type ATPase